MAANFVFTDEMAVFSNNLWMYTSVVGACMCFLVLVTIGILALHPVSRSHLDRVSFRVLAFALGTNTLFGIVNAVGGSITGPTWRCGLTIWVLQMTLQLSSFLMFCIALNMQLVIVHQINGQKMEKFYKAGSLFISLALTIPAYASNQYGWDPLVKDCWYANANQQERLAWQIGTQLFWTLFTVIGEVVTSLTVVIYMFRNRAVSSVLPKVMNDTQHTTSQSSHKHLGYARRYKNVLLRIALYPAASCLINLLSVMCVIHATATSGVHNMNDYRILLLSDFLYGGRAVVYATLAIFDPAYLAAWVALIQHERGSKSTFTTSSGTYHSQNGRSVRSAHLRSGSSKALVQVNLSTKRYNDAGIELDDFVGGPKSATAGNHFDHGLTKAMEHQFVSAEDTSSSPHHSSVSLPTQVEVVRMPLRHIVSNHAEEMQEEELGKFQKQI